jgi:uncharacterized protein
MNLRIWLRTAALAVAGVAAYAVLIEPRWLQLRRERVHIRSLPGALEGLRIGHVSDLHVTGEGTGRALGLVQRAVAALRRASPDMVAITGDLAEDEAGLRAVLRALEPLEPPLGVFVVPGNHDHRMGIDTWRRMVRSSGALGDLTNRHQMIERGGVRICVAGVDDLVEGAPSLRLPPPAARDLTILLAHSPDQAEQCRRGYDAIDLILSGHTHGGQVRFPFIGAPVSSAVHPELYEDGLRRRPWTQVYTTRGLGTTRLPIRFLARPEVTVLELTGSARPKRHRQATAVSLEMTPPPTHIPTPGDAGSLTPPAP